MERMRTRPKYSGKWMAGFAAAALLALSPHTASAGKFKILHSFCTPPDCADGAAPNGKLIPDSAGNLYGTASLQGAHNDGTAFEFKRQDNGTYKFKVLYSFNVAQSPIGTMILDTQGNLYGMGGRTAKGGIIYELSPGAGKNGKRWSFKELYQFCPQQQNCPDGSLPTTGALTYAGAETGAPYDGASPLYGTTSSGGANNLGVVFRLAPNGAVWEETVLYNFCSQGGAACTDGKIPLGGLVIDGSGMLYGTAAAGGTTKVNGGGGVVFALTQQGGVWSERVLYDFCSQNDCKDGSGPRGELAMDAQGNFFGVTAGGGKPCPIFNGGCGTIFQLTPNGDAYQETVLYDFCKRADCKDGADPEAGLLLQADGSLLGTTQYGGGNDIDMFGRGGGTVFKFEGSSLTVLHAFCALQDCADGEAPLAGLITDGFGNTFGDTPEGGSLSGGTTFRVKSD
ncbi:MAG TPA: choice-of-anchor tandem repeat GloVer-containing protein [Rhizomicrobium sp.]|nr:choice-of-anchor tandem repeat GloVer-containing protein [Rhizomicrobium sp.]